MNTRFSTPLPNMKFFNGCTVKIHRETIYPRMLSGHMQAMK
jgi:hypothetical protein